MELFVRDLRLKLGSAFGGSPPPFFSDQSPQNLDCMRVAVALIDLTNPSEKG